ncbi:MAG: thiamine/thiamine pyrophosphate ABC transporter permease ThiP [Alphaproteobacteria bacterium]|nr:thiamine/thiamine pyrophosphate ABC transporter permease ThiP [Alphaproteobacteria bacterium]
MADRAQQIRPLTLAGIAVAALLVAVSAGALLVVAANARGGAGLSASDFAALRFTILQALVSAALSSLLAIPVARALARRQFWCRRALILLLGAPFILPVIVAVLGLLAVFGRAGLISTLIAPLGLGPINIYGFQGVVLAHVFFNLPLATRLILQGWGAIPAEHFALAASLNMRAPDVARQLERPMLRAVLPGIFATVFLLSVASFAVVLALGGGPRATTLELAIYQAFRFDFDLSKAALLALMQLTLGLIAAYFAWRFASPAGFGAGLDRPVRRWDCQSRLQRSTDSLVLLAVTVFLVLPMAMIFLRGAAAVFELPPTVYFAAIRSLFVAVGSAFLAMLLALPLAILVVRLEGTHTRRAGLLEAAGYLSLATSPMVIGTGLFIVIFPLFDPARVALPLTALVNALMSLPFVLRIIIPPIRDTEADYGALAASLDLTGAAHFRRVLWPRIRRSAGYAAGLAAALSMGDLGVVALFADPDAATLPLMMYRLMAAYKMEAASGAGVMLVALSLGLFWIFDRGGRAYV